MLVQLILKEQIPSGKNQMRVTRDGHHYAEARFRSWREIAAYEVMVQKMRLSEQTRAALLVQDIVAQISYRAWDKTTRDLPGMQDALWHLLVHCGLLKDDGQIKGVTWQYPWRESGPCLMLELHDGRLFSGTAYGK